MTRALAWLLIILTVTLAPVLVPAVAWAACTGSSPNLSAPNTGNAVTNGTDLAACISAAVLGDTISLTAGAEYRGNFTLPDKGAGTSVIAIQTSVLTGLPANARVSPASASLMAKLTTATGSPIITLSTGAHHFSLIGLELTTTPAPFAAGQRVPFLVYGAGTFAAPVHDIVFDRILIHPAETDPVPARAAEEAFVIDGQNITLKNSYCHDFTGWEVGAATQTITAATNASPVQVAFSSSTPAASGTFLLYLTGGTGSWAGLNNVSLATFVDGTHATLQTFDPVTFALSPVNSTGWGSFSGQAVNVMPRAASTNRCVLITSGPGPYTLSNNFLESYYSPLFTGGGDQTVIDPQNRVTVSSVGSLSQVTLSGVGQLQVGDLIAFSATQDQTITTATAGNPTVLTVQTHRYPAGTFLTPEGCITVSGFTGAWAPVNGAWSSNGNGCGSGWAQVVDSTHISIPVDSTGFGAVTGSGMKWVLTTKNAPGNTQWVVGKVTNIAGNVVTFDWWGHQPQNTHGNGAGILIASGATAQFRGVGLSGITATRNTIGTKRYWIRLYRDKAGTAYNSIDQGPKACWEAKQASNVTMTGNTFEVFGGFADITGAVCLALNPANQIGATPWTSVNNWTIQSNLFKGYNFQKLSQIEEYESGTVSSGLLFDNNLMTLTLCSFLNLEGGDAKTITHNTVRNSGGGDTCGSTMFMSVIGPETNSIVRNNVARWNTGGYVICPGGSCSGWTPTISHNFLVGGDTGSSGWQAGDTAVTNDTNMGFTNVASADAGGDYHGYQLTGTTACTAGNYRNCGSDGTDPGVNFAALDAALGGTAQTAISGGVQIQGGVTVK